MSQRNKIGIPDHFDDAIPLENRKVQWIFSDSDIPDKQTNTFVVYSDRVKILDYSKNLEEVMNQSGETQIISHYDESKFFVSLQLMTEKFVKWFVISPDEEFIKSLKECNIVSVGNLNEEWEFHVCDCICDNISNDWNYFLKTRI